MHQRIYTTGDPQRTNKRHLFKYNKNDTIGLYIHIHLKQNPGTKGRGGLFKVSDVKVLYSGKIASITLISSVLPFTPLLRPISTFSSVSSQDCNHTVEQLLLRHF